MSAAARNPAGNLPAGKVGATHQPSEAAQPKPAREAGLSLGSNLGHRRAQIGHALRRLEAEVFAGMEVSSLWETAPFEAVGEQPPYLNLCVVGATSLSPEELLARCRNLERQAGRADRSHGLARPLDIDLLYFGEMRREDRALTLPHPGLARRRFVLAPLAELRPDWRHPASGRSVRELLGALDESQAARIVETGDGWWHLA